MRAFRLPFMFALALIPALAVPTPAGAQCCNGSFVSTPTATVATTWSDGWFRHENGHVEHWVGGKLVSHAFPGDENWDYCLSAMSQRCKQNLGFIPMPPQVGAIGKCLCGPGCRCVDCPSDCACPDGRCPLPTANRQLLSDPFPGGVQATRIPQAAAYEVNGKAASRESAFKMLRGVGGDGLVDDTAKPFLTAVLPDAERKKFVADMATHPALAPWKGKLHLNDYAPTDWQVSQIGLSAGVSYQGPPDAQGKSKVLFRLRSYDGPEVLAAALRNPDGGYTPDKDPDPTKPAGGGKSPTPPPASPSIDAEQATTWGAGAIALLSTGAFVLRRRFGV